MNKSSFITIGKGVAFIFAAAVVMYIGSRLLAKGTKQIPMIDTLASKVGA